MTPQDAVQSFDREDFKNCGRPLFFDPDHYLDAVEQMICADELIQALHMLDNMPGWYRMNPYPRAQAIKTELNQRIWSISNYADDPAELYENALEHQRRTQPQIEWHDLGQMIDIYFCFPRGPILLAKVQELNAKGIKPFIWELGPANYWLAHGLKLKGCEFDYYAKSMNKAAMKDHQERLQKHWKEKPDEGQFQIFVCFETIEHLWRHEDIRQVYDQYSADADLILMSTPCGTLFNGLPDWRRELGHLRTFTPQEFVDIASRMFPDRKWQCHVHHMMVIEGEKNGTGQDQTP